MNLQKYEDILVYENSLTEFIVYILNRILNPLQNTRVARLQKSKIAFYNLSQGDAKNARKSAGDFAGEIAELEAERQMAIAWSKGEPASEKPDNWEYWKEREGLSEPVEGENEVKGGDDIKEPSVREEFLLNGDKRIINYNSRGQVSTVATERDGKIHSVDSYDDGALFETTTYDENGRSTSVTRYDKNGDVLKVYKFDDSDAAEGEKNGVPSVQEQVEIAESDVNTTPTEGQKEAGNYKKGHVQIGKFNVTIEQPKGSVRSGVDANGNKWETEMQNTYGYIRGTEGVDGDHIDVFLSSDIDGWDGKDVFVVDQYNEDGSFDEHKVMLGFNEAEEAHKAYLSNYEKDWSQKHKNVVTAVSIESFEKWINQSHRKTKAFAEYKSIKGENGVPSVQGRVEEWNSKTGEKVRVVNSVEEVSNAEAREAIENGVKVKGWYDTKSKETVIYAPNVRDVRDVDLTVIHEVVSHKGLRDTLGEEVYDRLCDKTWEMMGAEAQAKYENYPGVGNIKDETKRRRAAADEYIASIAEKEEANLTEAERSVWAEVLKVITDFIKKLFSDAKITEDEIRTIIRASYRRMRETSKTNRKVESPESAPVNVDNGRTTKETAVKKGAKSRRIDAKREIDRRVAEEWSDAPSDIKDELLRLSETSEPLDVEDVVYEYLEGLRSPKTRNKLLLQGDGVLKGVTDELGLPAKELQKALGMNAFATRANGGISLQKMAERIAEDMDSNIAGSSDVDSTDIRDILIDAISSASEPADISYHRARKRVKMAEKLYSDWKRNEEALEAEYARDADAYNAYVENELIELEKVAKMLPEGGITAIFADEYIREQQIREQYERTTERSDRGSEILQGKRVDTSRGVESSPDGRTVSEKIGGRVLEGANADAQGGQVAGATKREVRAEEGIVAESGKGEKGKKGVKAGENRLPEVEAAIRESETRRVAAKLEGLDRRLAEIGRELREDREGERIQAQADAMVELYGGYANAPAEVRARIDNQVARLSERRRELIEEEKRIEAEIKKTVSDFAKGKTGKADAGGTRFSVYGGNSGYEGYSMSKRAREAREAGRFPKTDFKKEYGLNERELTALVDAGIVSDKEWHHTSKYGNKTVFYGFANRGATDYYNANKERVKQAIKDGTIGDLLPEFADASDAYDVKESDRINKELEDYRRDTEKREEYYEYLKTVIPSEYTASNGVVVDSKGSNLQFMWSATRNGKKPKNKNAVYKAFEEFAEFLSDKVPSFEEWSKEGVRFSVRDEDKKGINVPKEEYAKIAHQIASYPNKAERGHVFTDKNYYLCDGIDAEGNFTILAKLPIVGNEDLINKLRGENGRRNFKAIENSEDITATIEEIKRRRRRPNRNISSLKRQSRIDGRDDSVYLGEQPNFDRNQQTAKSDDKEIDIRFRVDDEDVAVKALLGNQHIFDGMRKLEEGETSYVERTFSENKSFEFNSKNFIKGYDDVAYIFKQLENESVENAFAVLVKNGRPTVIHLGMGGFTQTMVNQSGLNVAVNRVKPDKIYFVHNHPSGTLKSSVQDRSILNELILAYGSDVVQYGVIINSFTGKYGIFSSDIEGMSYDIPNEQEGDRPIKVYSFNKQVYDKNYQPTTTLRGSEEVAAFITSQRLGDRQKIGLLVADNQLRITGNIFLPYSEFTRENADKIANDIAYYTAVMGGNRAFLFGNASMGDLNGKNISERVKNFSGGQIQMLDYVEINGGRHKSAYDEGVRFSVREEELKPIGKGEFGDIYDQFKGKTTEAIQFLSKKKGGEAIGALHHPQVGYIDLVWGKEGTGKSNGFGLSKLLKFHPEVVNNLQEVINEMHITKKSKNRIQLESDTHQAAVRLTWNDKNKNWLLTAFKKKNSVFDNTTDTDETFIQGKKNDTATLQNAVNLDKDTNNVENTTKENELLFDKEENIRFRVDDEEEQNLVGVHNLTEANLAHVAKMGGIANPSMAVVNRDIATLDNFGEITLVASKALVDKKSGKNAGTWGADAYSPRYPRVEYRLSDKSSKDLQKRGFAAGLESFDITSLKQEIESNGKRFLVGDRRIQKLYTQEGKSGESVTDYVDRLYDSLDITERLFKGYTWDGTRRYAKHTLENVSRMMKAEGRAGAEGYFGMGSVRAKLTPIFRNIAQIKKNKDRIVSHEEFEEAKNSLESRYYELVKLTSVERFDNAAEDRLIEALLSLNPKKYLKEEYNIEISDEDAEAIKTFAADLRVMPTEYFETKFERPVMLEEFAKAVIPNDASDKTRKILANAGLEVVEYDPKVEGDRLRAVREASDKEGVRFRFIGEKGAVALDKAEEASVRLDNLDVAREMETSGKSAKDVKMATGWERGADGKWRYEVGEDFDFDLNANIDFGKRKPEILADYKRYRELLHKQNAFYLLSEGENLTPDEETELKRLRGLYRGTQLHNSHKLKDYIDAPELFTAYPELRDVEVRIDELGFGERGKYNSKENKITLSNDLRNKSEYKSTLAHEIQHAIQHIEGFARGGHWQREDYYQLSGEVEARNVARRMGMSAEERRNSLAEETEDVSRKDQLFIMDNLGVSAMVEKSVDKKGKHSKEDSQDLTTIIVSSKNADAKIRISKEAAKNNLDNLSETYLNTQNTRGFLGDLKRALGETKTQGQSSYFDFNTNNGEVTLRISNHNANAENVKGERDVISVIIKSERTKNNYKDAEGVNLTEFAYFKERIAKADGNTLSQIAESIKDMLDTGVYVDKSGIAVVNPANSEFAKTKRADEQTEVSEAGLRFRLVDDAKEVDALEKDKKVKGYRNVELHEDGGFTAAMADRLGGNGLKVKTEKFYLDEWRKSDETPEIVKPNGKVDLIKPKGLGTVANVDYNPYNHHRQDMVNAQFKQAWERPDLVFVECEIPESDVLSGYQAEKAALPVGVHSWSNGDLILSRYSKATRIVPWAEVAEDWVKRFSESGVHFDIVPPALLPILNERGVEILPPHKGMGKACNDAYKEWSKEGVRFRVEEVSEKTIENVVVDKDTAPKTRQEAIMRLSAMKQPFLNKDQNIGIYVSNRDARHIMQFRNSDQIAVVGSLPTIIERAVKIGEFPVDQDEQETTKTVSVYYCPIKVGEIQYSGRMIVKEYYEGTHSVDELHLYNVMLKKSALDAQNVSPEGLPIYPTSTDVYKVKDLIHNSQEQDKKLLGITADTRFSVREDGEYVAPWGEGESFAEAMDRLSRKKNVLNVEVQRMERRRAMGGDIDEADEYVPVSDKILNVTYSAFI